MAYIDWKEFDRLLIEADELKMKERRACKELKLERLRSERTARLIQHQAKGG
jgi:hypothetical protein